MTSEVMIRADRLTKAFGSNIAVSDVSFSCARGEVVAFLGPNGAGKTTTMRMLAGYMPPTSGRASVAGYDTLDASMQARQHLGYLPETVPLYPEMRVEDYLAFVGRLRRLDDLWDRVDDALETVDMLERAEEFIGDLSKGMRQRVGLAQALIHDPAVLILDEPTIGLDPAQIREVRELIARLGERHTILLSTHILGEVEQICSRVLMIFDGRLSADMSMDEIRGDARSLVNLRLANAPEEALKTLRSIDGVLDASPSVDGFTLMVDRRPDIRARVAERVVTEGWGLLELSPERLSLESVFLSKLRETEMLSGQVMAREPGLADGPLHVPGEPKDEEE